MVRFRRMVYWRDDTFGVDMIFTAEGGQKTPGNSITEDCDSIYNKSTWGGIIIDQRGIGENRWVDGVGIRDFRIEYPGRNKPIIKMYLPEYPCSFKNVLLKNISTLTDNGHPFQITGGGPESIIESVTFEDIKLNRRKGEGSGCTRMRGDGASGTFTFRPSLFHVRTGRGEVQPRTNTAMLSG